MKLFTAVAVSAVLVLGTAACSGGGNSAKDKYEAFADKYEPVFKDLAEAFGEDPSDSAETFEEWVKSSDACEPIDDEGAALGGVLLAPTLEEHGLSWVEFLKDYRGVVSAVKAEGHCDGTASTSPSPTTTVPVGPDPALVDYCEQVADSITEGLTAMSDGADLLPYADAATVQEFLQTAKEFVATSKSSISTCRPLAPAEVDELLAQLDALDSALDSVSYVS